MFLELFATILLTLQTKAQLESKGTAYFSGDINGTVVANNGYVILNLTFGNFNFSMYGVDDNCSDGGLYYHVHEKWTHNTTDSMFGTDCGSTYTGGHWDPWLACGPATGNDYCFVDGGCVNGSSVLDLGYYTCSFFDDNPYSCEVGDWSGKYGSVEISDNMIYMTGYSPYEVDGYDLENRSIVFHCNDGQRAFCAPFTDFEYNFNQDRPTQDATNLVADIGNYGYYTIDSNGTNILNLIQGLFILPDNCGDYLYYRVFDEWDSDSDYELGSDCDDIVGGFYDPTVSCATNSSNIYCNFEDGVLCDDLSYEYTCDYNEAGVRFLCAPGDLSGKFGAVESNATGSEIWISDDELMIDINLLNGKSFVIQCSDTYEIVACAGWQNKSMPEFDTTATADIDTSSASSSSEDSDGCNYGVQYGFPLAVDECNGCIGIDCPYYGFMVVCSDNDEYATLYGYDNVNCEGDYINATNLTYFSCGNSETDCEVSATGLIGYNTSNCSDDAIAVAVLYTPLETVCSVLDGFGYSVEVTYTSMTRALYTDYDCDGTPFIVINYTDAECDGDGNEFFFGLPLTTTAPPETTSSEAEPNNSTGESSSEEDDGYTLSSNIMTLLSAILGLILFVLLE